MPICDKVMLICDEVKLISDEMMLIREKVTLNCFKVLYENMLFPRRNSEIRASVMLVRRLLTSVGFQ
jgi:hypothetical protein